MRPEKLGEILDALNIGLSDLLGNQFAAIYLYGSQSRGDARVDSDIDILVVLYGEFNYFEMVVKTSFLTADLSLRNDIVISCAFVSQAEFESLQTPFLINIRRDGVLV